MPAGEGFPFQVTVVEELGSDAYAYGNLQLGADAGVADDKMFIARVDPRRPPAKGETVHLRIRESEEHVFHPDTGERIGAAHTRSDPLSPDGPRGVRARCSYECQAVLAGVWVE